MTYDQKLKEMFIRRYMAVFDQTREWSEYVLKEEHPRGFNDENDVEYAITIFRKLNGV